MSNDTQDLLDELLVELEAEGKEARERPETNLGAGWYCSGTQAKDAARWLRGNDASRGRNVTLENEH